MIQSEFLKDLRRFYAGEPEEGESRLETEVAADYSSALVQRYREGNTAEFESIFERVEHHLIFGSEEDHQLILVGFLENLKNVCAYTDLDYAVFEEWLGPETHVAWRWLEKRWQGKRSLASTARDAGFVESTEEDSLKE